MLEKFMDTNSIWYIDIITYIRMFRSHLVEQSMYITLVLSYSSMGNWCHLFSS